MRMLFAMRYVNSWCIVRFENYWCYEDMRYVNSYVMQKISLAKCKNFWGLFRKILHSTSVEFLHSISSSSSCRQRGMQKFALGKGKFLWRLLQKICTRKCEIFAYLQALQIERCADFCLSHAQQTERCAKIPALGKCELLWREFYKISHPESIKFCESHFTKIRTLQVLIFVYL